jgi:hypothetical protein
MAGRPSKKCVLMDQGLEESLDIAKLTVVHIPAVEQCEDALAFGVAAPPAGKAGQARQKSEPSRPSAPSL